MNDPVDANLIAAYLSAHPDFFNQFPELLTTLSITHPHGTHAISITERQVLSMRDKVHLLEGKLAELIRFGEENDSISEKMHKLSLDIISARDINELLAVLALHLREGFAVPHHVVRIWNTPEQPVSDGLKQEIDNLMHPSCGALRIEEAYSWFGEAAAHLKSFAAVPLRGQHTVGLLVLGSEDPKRFYPEMGTLYLERLGQLIGAALTRMA
ncbi:MAG: DUF484 family protein [Hydrogenophilaceae bacterium]|nr:DUF484 family protein [Hydrogenophilaceae bacterium]